MTTSSLHGRLHIGGRHVGNVAIRGWEGAWGIGDFTPNGNFAEFAPLFEEWSRLMHADAGRLSRANAQLLRDLENRMYGMRVAMWVEEMHRWRQVVILNIDGAMIEWKEPAASAAGSKATKTVQPIQSSSSSDPAGSNARDT